MVAALTLFSGFGLGTLLMPVFAIFFSVEMAIAATAVVHLLNNVFKAILVGRYARFKVVILFAIPAAICAMIGAWILGKTSGLGPIYTYILWGRSCEISLIKLIIAFLITFFALVELFPHRLRLRLGQKFIPLGGALSGFFGGLSGHQGALRSAFLVNLGLSKEAFIGTVVLSAIAVDISRLSIYGLTFVSRDVALLKEHGLIGLMVAGTIAAFIGSFVGSRLLRKITMRTVQIIVGSMLMILATALGSGLI